MIKRTIIVVSMMILFFAGGCASTRKPQNLSESQVVARKEAMIRVLKNYAKAIRGDDVNGVMNLLNPRLTEPEQRKVRYRVEAAVWLKLYSGYRVLPADIFKAADSVMLRRNVTEVPVIARNADGQVLRNTATMAWNGSQWHMLSLPLSQALVGEAVDLPEVEEEEVMAAIDPIMKGVREGSLGKIIAILPENEAALIRRKEPGFLAGLLGAKAEKYPLPQDLRRVKEFSFTDWPGPNDAPSFAYLGPKSVMAIYDIPYTWETGGIFDDSLRIEILLTLADGEWTVKLLRMHGKGMPGGE